MQQLEEKEWLARPVINFAGKTPSQRLDGALWLHPK
jgi:hypothetical protein